MYSLHDTRDFLTRATALCLKYPEGFISGAAAARYWGLRRGIPDHFEFTVPESSCRPKGVRFAQVRYSSTIGPHDVFDALDGLRVSSPARAVFEAASRLDEFGLRSMIQDGIRSRRVDIEALRDVGARLCGPGRRGTRLFRDVIDAALEESPVDSEEELIVLDALRVALPFEVVSQQPVRLASGATIHLDLGIPAAWTGVEVDGPTHDDPIQVHRDKSRDLQAAVVGWHVVRVRTEDVRARLRVVTAQVQAVARGRAEVFSRQL